MPNPYLELLEKKYIWICCPETKCCCFCTKSLKLGTALICIWAILASSHETMLVLRPTCHDLYDNDTGELHEPLIVLKWMVFFVSAGVFLAGSALLVFGVFYHRAITADIFIITGLLSICTTIPYSVLSASQMWEYAACPFNINDVLIMVIYNICWIYFVAVVASYRKQMNKAAELSNEGI